MKQSLALRALADPYRQQIVERLSVGPASVRELTQLLGLSQPTVSHHLKLMKDAGIVASVPAGASNVYHIDPHGLAPLRAWLDQHWARALTAFKEVVEQDGNDNAGSNSNNDCG